MVVTLGVDIGTTSVKTCLVEDGHVLGAVKCSHNAKIIEDNRPMSHLFDEQDPLLILKALDDCLEKIPCHQASSIRICGQMHGVVLWNPVNVPKCNTNLTLKCLYQSAITDVSRLITWQDKRCHQDFLKNLPCSPSFCKIATGYGIASLLWLKRNQKLPDTYTLCGTIMDFVVWLLTQTKYVYMTTHSANSWGYFDVSKACWEVEQIPELAHLLPRIVSVGHRSGSLVTKLHGMATDTVVYTALGDMQCSIHSSTPAPNEAILNIGTSSQLSFMLKNDACTIKAIRDKCHSLDCVPYKNNDVIITAASLTGGNVLDNFVSTVQSWLLDLECNSAMGKQDLFKKLEDLANTFRKTKSNTRTCLVIDPCVFGERYSPNSLASATNITTYNSSLGEITWALHRGIIENLSTMLPVELLKKHGVEAVVGTGGFLVENCILKEAIEEVYKLPLRVSSDSDAAYGAAMF
ncbi:sedoheptulokinase-like [Hydractinia symbiolongicarpus]|uniref:sedoheptulokinase-like n=1 Tax=Hydractinia symbiolongicarpus TaxID=13093 RepID=UPI00254C4F83|nr:sedoheptulokinase-like [Hydractinia symbiolongicarpus]